MRLVSPPTAASLARYADAALEGGWLVAAALVPLYMDLLRAQPSLARGQLLQVLALWMALVWALRWVAARQAAAGTGPPAGRLPGAWWAPLKLPGGAPLVALAGAYAGTTLLATALAPVPGVALWGAYLRGEGAAATLAYMVLFLVVADRLRTRAQLDRLVNVLLAASVPVCLYAVAQAAGFDPIVWGRGVSGRVVATGGNAIFLAAYLILLVPLTVWRLREAAMPIAGARRGSWVGPLVLAGAIGTLALVFAAAVTRPQAWWGVPALLAGFALLVAVLPPFALPPALGGAPAARRCRLLGYGALLALQLLVIVLTASRGPVVGLAVAVVVATGLAAWRARRWRQLAVVGAMVALGMAGVGALWMPNSPLLPLAERVPLVRRIADLRLGETGARLQVWRTVAEALERGGPVGEAPDLLAAARPWIGYGPESVVYQLNRVLPPPRALELMLGEFWDRAHNASLDRLLTTGLLGLVAYWALVLTVIVVALRRAPPRAGAWGWGLYHALGVALLAHFVESQFSMLALPGEAVFWLLAGVAVGPPGLDQPSPASSAPRRRPARGRAGPGAAEAPGEAPGWGLAALYAGAAVIVTLLLLQAPAPSALLVAAGLLVAALLLAPTVAGFALRQPVAGEPPGAVGPALGAALVALGLALALGAHQVRVLAADVAFRRAETSQVAGSYSGAITAAQQAVRLAPDQPEYYHILGQYFGALAGTTRTPPLPGFVPSLDAVRDSDPARLGRDQLFALGDLSVREAVRLDPLEARYHLTLGELHRYWAEVAETPGPLAVALASFERAARLKPNDVEVHAGIADTLLLRGEAAAAAERARYAAGLLPTYWYPYAVEARAQRRLDQPAEALRAAGDALTWAVRGPGQKQASAHDLERLREIVRWAIASGRTPLRPGVLARGAGSHPVYLIDDAGQKRWLVSEAALQSCGYTQQQVQLFADALLAEVPSGPDIAGC